ncbi:MAG: hypothetical protein K8L99_13055 [Anaerolineae bacterium]|nr:hypothetical protein [Anaerolineae bacterium]
MPIHTFWDDDQKTIIQIQSKGQWTWEEFHKSLDQTVEMIESVDHRVDVINVECPGAVMPPGPPIIHFQRVTRLFENFSGLYITVITSSLSLMIMRTFTRLPMITVPDSFRAVNYLNEAYALIEADRTKEIGCHDASKHALG